METLRRSRHGPQAQYLQNLLTRRGYAISARNAVDPKVRAACGVPVAEPGSARSAFGDRRHVMSIDGNRILRVQGFSYVLSRMDRLLGCGRVP